MTSIIRKLIAEKSVSGQVLRELAVAELLGISLSTLRAKRRIGDPGFDESFPLPLRIGENTIAYLEIEILEWLASRERVTTGGQK